MIGDIFSGIAGLFGGGNQFQAKGISQQNLDDSIKRTQQGLDYANQFYGQMAPGGQQAAQSQQALLGQLGLQAQGQGPNPALAQLAQATGANTANQAALMAGQRGAGANAGMLARQAAMQGAANQQGAAGQAATLAAQQQLAAQQALQNQQAQMVNQQAGSLGQYNQAALGSQQALWGAQNAADQLNAQTAAANAKQRGGALGGLLGGAASALAGPMASMFGSQKSSNPLMAGQSYLNAGSMAANGGMVGPKSFLGQHLAQGGNVMDYTSGGPIPGRARVAGDSLKNDVVPIVASPQEIVLPRSVTLAKNAGERAKEFVEKVKAKHRMKR